MAKKAPERESRVSTSAPWILGTLGAAAAGMLAWRPGSSAWLESLDRPAWMLAGWLFAPLTGAILIAMGVAATLVWRERERVPVRQALTLYVTQLACIALWPHLFFGSRATHAAMLDLSFLWILAALTAVAFHRARVLAALLLVPELAFLTYAAALNLSLWLRNG